MHFFDTFSTSEPPKVVRDRQFLTLLTWKCASRHNGVHFFDISTSKSGPELRCFVHFDLEMCFAPQRRATFHLSSDQLAPHPPLQRAYFSTLRSHKSLEKHSVSRLSYLFAHLHLLSSDLFSSDSSHLCFSTVHIVGSFTSKLPSIMVLYVATNHARATRLRASPPQKQRTRESHKFAAFHPTSFASWRLFACSGWYCCQSWSMKCVRQKEAGMRRPCLRNAQ